LVMQPVAAERPAENHPARGGRKLGHESQE
jgi:hypothetical protein